MTFKPKVTVSPDILDTAFRLSRWIEFLSNRSDLERMFRFSARNQMSYILYIYTVYIQPITAMSLIFMLVVMTKTNIVWYRYGFMIIHIVLDLLALIILLPFQFIFLEHDDFMDYRWCTPYQIMTVIVPGILFALSTWMKVGMALQKLIFIRYPFKSKVFLSGKLVAISIFSLAVIGGVLNSFHMYRYGFKKAIVLNEETREVEYKCSITYSYIDKIRISQNICQDIPATS